MTLFPYHRSRHPSEQIGFGNFSPFPNRAYNFSFMSSPVNNIAMPHCAAILLIGFNRPDLLRGLVTILAKVRPPKIYLAVDGPRPDHPGEAEKCAACVAVADTINWPCDVHKLGREKNFGCRLAVSGAIDWFFSQEEEGIILEDDCWPDPSFLRFATELLDRYRHDGRVGMISGNNHYGFMSDQKASYRFTNAVLIWGWATWRRAWRLNQPDPEVFRVTGSDIIRKANLTRRMRTMCGRFLKDVLESRSTWDVTWMLSLQSRGLLSIVPRRNLVANMACGRTGGTHTDGFAYDQYLYTQSFAVEFPLVHPSAVERDEKADRLYELRTFAWLPRILTVVGLRCGAFGRTICYIARRIELVFPALFRL